MLELCKLKTKGVCFVKTKQIILLKPCYFFTETTAWTLKNS